MTLFELLDRYLNLLVKPIMAMTLSIVAALVTAASFVLQFKLPSSVKKFRSLWFSRLWSLLGPISAKGDAPHVRPLIKQAYGVVVELGPGTGLTVRHFDKTKVTKIYGVEPCLEMHPELQRNIKAAGLSDIYTIVGCGAQDTAELRRSGIAPGSVDTILTIKVLCSVPTSGLERTLESLYDLLVPGGQWLVFEHVKNKRSWLTKTFQSFYQIAWPYLFSGCNINRLTDEMLAAAGPWDRNELDAPKEEPHWEITPHTTGRLVKVST